MSALLLKTLGNPAWMSEHTAALKALLPETWTHVSNINPLQLGFRLKVVGIDWRSDQEFGQVMAYFVRCGILQRDGALFRRAP